MYQEAVTAGEVDAQDLSFVKETGKLYTQGGVYGGGGVEARLVYTKQEGGQSLTEDQIAYNVETYNKLIASGNKIVTFAYIGPDMPLMPVTFVVDLFGILLFSTFAQIFENSIEVTTVMLVSDGDSNITNQSLLLNNSVEAAIIEFNLDGSALTAEQKAHNRKIFQKISTEKAVQVYANGIALAPLQQLSISDTEIIFYSTLFSPSGSLVYDLLKLTSDGDLQTIESKEYPLGGSSEGGVAELMVSTTYADLVALRDAGNLVPGMKYRITDYETITTKAGSQSAGHPFDIIVTALDNKTISENASAIQSARDTDGYFAQANLKAWQLKYALDNLDGRFDFVPQDTPVFMNVSITAGGYTASVRLRATGIKDVINEKKCYIFVDLDRGQAFASESEDLQAGGSILILGDNQPITGTINSVENVPKAYNSKGVIYRMIDAQGNSCPYDFKNIKFLRTDTEGAETYEYTFSNHSANGQKDYSEYNPGKCYDNFMADGCWDNVFVHMFDTRISGNKFGDGCTGNTFGEETYNVILGAECENNTLAGYNNGCVFGNKCTNNYLDTTSANCIFGNNSSYNKLGKASSSNRFGNYFRGNTIGANCIHNSFGEVCSANVLGNGCQINHFGNYCVSIELGRYSFANTFGNECSKIRFTESANSDVIRDRNYYNVVDNGCKSVNIYVLGTTSEFPKIQNVHIYSGLQGTTSNPVNVEIPASDTAFSYSVAKNSAGELKIYVEADLVQ